jgi:hypothetical protein
MKINHDILTHCRECVKKPNEILNIISTHCPFLNGVRIIEIAQGGIPCPNGRFKAGEKLNLVVYIPKTEPKEEKQDPITPEKRIDIESFLSKCLTCKNSKYRKHGEERSVTPADQRLTEKYAFLGFQEDRGIEGLCCSKVVGCQKDLLKAAVKGECPGA